VPGRSSPEPISPLAAWSALTVAPGAVEGGSSTHRDKPVTKALRKRRSEVGEAAWTEVKVKMESDRNHF
jgi:hypothetical protein